MSILAIDDFGQRIQALRPGVAQTVPVGPESRTSAGFGSVTTVVRLVATSHCRFAFGDAPAATEHSHYLPAGIPEYFRVVPGEKLAALRVAGDGVLYITEMT